jgi:hypothetical protein
MGGGEGDRPGGSRFRQGHSVAAPYDRPIRRWSLVVGRHVQQLPSNRDVSITARTPKVGRCPRLGGKAAKCSHQGEASKERRMSAGQQARRAERATQQAVDSGPIKTLGRVGLIAYGVVNLLVAYLALRVVLGGGVKADKTGALQMIAEQPAGRFLLWVLTAGLAALMLWQLAEAGWGHQRRHPQPGAPCSGWSA